MIPYSDYNTEDFAADDSFVKWVLKKDPEATRFWESFRDQNPRVQVRIDNAVALVQGMHKAQRPPEDPMRVQRVWLDIEKELSQDDVVVVEQRRSTFTVSRIAASFAVIIILSGLTWFSLRNIFSGSGSPATVEETGEFVEEINTTGGLVRIHLSDGSVVELENNSRLKYKKDYAETSTRNVYLEGEAFFKIAKDPQRPFLVHANEVVTKVLGTSFRVKAYHDEKDILVSVKEGKVSVYSAVKEKKAQGKNHETVNGVILTPNQQVIYTRQEDTFARTLIASPTLVTDEKAVASFVFENEPVSDVFATLEKAYGVEIIYNQDLMKDCFFTAALENEPLFQKLKIICRTIGASYEQIDAKIVVSGKGCQSVTQDGFK